MPREEGTFGARLEDAYLPKRRKPIRLDSTVLVVRGHGQNFTQTQGKVLYKSDFPDCWVIEALDGSEVADIERKYLRVV
jgi:hypothetical protein